MVGERDVRSTTLRLESGGPSAAELAEWVTRLAELSCPDDDAARIDRIAALERLKSAAAAAQARESVAFHDSQLAAQAAAGVPHERRGGGIGAQVALARRESPHCGARLLGLARALVDELPHTMAALTAGDISEWRAILVTRETACLSRGDRAEVDARLAARLATLSDGQVVGEARGHAYALDPYAFVDRLRRAVADRRVTARPAPDAMAIISALLPAAQGVAVQAALSVHADAQRAAGDSRTRQQLMADTLVERVTGQARADQVPVEVQLLMSEATLLTGDMTPARLAGYGALPAPYARQLVRTADEQTAVWLRRLYVDRFTGRLTRVESRRRAFRGAVRRQIVARDSVCRTPWCGAPIRHIDHAVPYDAGGETSEANGQGLCEACNYAKQSSGWTSAPGPGGAGESVVVTTPTGHEYVSRPPPLAGVARGVLHAWAGLAEVLLKARQDGGDVLAYADAANRSPTVAPVHQRGR